MSNVGKSVRLARLMPQKRMLLVPVDDGLSSGPEGGLRDIRTTLKRVVVGGADGILCHRGILSACYDLIGVTPVIVNVTASTTLGSFNEKVLIGSVEGAAAIGAAGVSIHVNISSKFEPSMLAAAGKVIVSAEKLGMPVLIHIYPRGESNENIEYYASLKSDDQGEYARLVRHVARIGVELGADIVKVPYTGDTDSFSSVVDGCVGIPVVAAGGAFESMQSTLDISWSCMKAGASGISFGRRVFNCDDPERLLPLLRRVVHQGQKVDLANTLE